jgi:hypothetical protein
MSWDELVNEGNETVKIIRLGLNKRGFITGDSCKTVYGTDEDIPIFNNRGDKLFWISVKTAYGKITDPKKINFPGWMCGEIDSKQWCNPPAIIIWFCRETGVAWGAITPKRLSLKWLVFPNQSGKIIDQRKTRLLKRNIYIYPSYCVPVSEIIMKDEVIQQINLLIEEKS